MCHSGKVENEFHFIMICKAQVIPRNILFLYWDFNNLSNGDKFIYLLEKQN